MLGNEPERKTSSFYEVKLFFQGYGGAARITSNRPMVNPISSERIQTEWDTTFDGDSHSRALQSREDAKAHQGTIYPAFVGNADIQTASYKPISFAFRPLLQGYLGRPTLDKYGITASSSKPNQGKEEGKLLHLAAGIREIWVEPQENYLVRKYVVTLRNGKLFRTLEVSKAEKKGEIWMPVEWKCVNYSCDGIVTSIFEFSVVSFSLDPPLKQDDFLLEFPKETLITDYSKTGA